MSATLHFLADWSHRQDGPIYAGEPLLVEYAAGRFPVRREYIYIHDRFAFAWTIVAHARFLPGGEYERRAWNRHQGTVTFDALDVPLGTRHVELWFTYDDRARPGTRWDSRYGQNYRFEVLAAPSGPYDIELAGELDAGCAHREGTRDVELG